jgi:RNA polymerase sigma factor (sigma-70 family)
MAGRISTIVFGTHIRTLFDVGALGAMPDRGLLDHFAKGGESSEAAFATLVQRHGSMVLRVCRHLLTDRHLAEDAFQVTFLSLARRASSIHNPDALAGWLHRVARRVALRALAGIRRRKDFERIEAGEIAVADDDPLERAELCAIVHEEIDRLGDDQRLPILLCALQGLSHEEAAQRLRWPVGTVKSRLVRGRRRLARRLARRGLAPAVALAGVLAGKPASAASVPAALLVGVTRAALQSAAVAARSAAPVSLTVSASTSLLLHEVMSALFLAKVALAAGAALAACAAAILIGITVAGPFGQHAQEVEPRSHEPRTTNATVPTVPRNAPTVRTTDPTSATKTARVVPENLSAVSGGEKGNQVVAIPQRRLSELGEQVERAIQGGVQFLKAQQQPDGTWKDIDNDAKTGVTSLATLALLAAGEKSDSPAVRKALEYLRGFGPNELRSTYAVSLQTQVFVAAEPGIDQLRIASNVGWLERAQFGPADSMLWPGAWTYSDSLKRARPGDNSNTQSALLALFDAHSVGVLVKTSVWDLSRPYWEKSQRSDGSWAYTRDTRVPTASMTCAGISSLVMSGLGRSQGQEFLEDETIKNCGKGTVNRNLEAGIDWLASHFRVDQNFGNGPQWKLYYLAGLERAGRFAGVRFFGEHDWYREGAQELVRAQDRPGGHWQGSFIESDRVVATSFALQFLASGRTPVLINKLRHAPSGDWNNDPDDVRNIVSVVARDRNHPVTWQVVDSPKATLADLLRAPILFINGHKAPEFDRAEKKNLRDYVDRGGFIFAEACCGSADFATGFRRLTEELFPEKQDELRRLADSHPIWRTKHRLPFEIHPLWGISRGGRTAVIYSQQDLSCYWNQSGRNPANPEVVKAIKVGQNVIDYVTGGTLPPDKLSVPIEGREHPALALPPLRKRPE